MKKIVCLLLILVVANRNLKAQSIDPSHKVPVNKMLSADWEKSLWQNKKTVYRGDELLTIGMPCGGIASGQLCVRGDGTLGDWWISNNAYNTGYGLDKFMNFKTALGPWKVCYQTFEPMSYIDQGFSILYTQKGKTISKTLNKENFDDISFIGEYPVASIHYASKTETMPVDVTMKVFSPFIPLNARESATPATIFRFTLKNNSKESTEISLTGWLQNMVCLDLKGKALGRLHNTCIQSDDLTTVFMDFVKPEIDTATKKIPRTDKTFEDFESGSYGKWKVEGTAFGSRPTTPDVVESDQVRGEQGKYLVNSRFTSRLDTATGKLISPSFIISDHYINFRIGGGYYQGKTCINLIVDGQIVATMTGNMSDRLKESGWNVEPWKGKEAHIEIVDNETGDWGHISIDDIQFSNTGNSNLIFPEKHPFFGNLSLSVIGANSFSNANFARDELQVTPVQEATSESAKKLIGAVGASLKLAPGESKDLTFLLTWYFPNRPVPEDASWNMPLNTDTPIIKNMYANWFNSSRDVTSYLKKNLTRLTEQTFLFHDTYYKNSTIPYWLNQRLMMPVSTLATETSQWWANDKFWAWEGVGSCMGTCTHVWNYEQAMAHLFPELERNVRDRTDFETSFQPDGGIMTRNGTGDVAIDGHAGTILKSYREYLNSVDNAFLVRNWDRIRKATEYLIRRDVNDDGLIENEQFNTYDISFSGANTYVGSLYLAALKSAAKMAADMGDTVFRQKCELIFERGEKNTVRKLWNGEYFFQDVDLKKYPKSQYANGCLSDQLFGQTWAHLNGLGYIYPKDKVKTALQSIWNYNWAPQVGVQTNIHRPERVYADPGEAGLLICTWPHNPHMGEDGVRYRDEVWTGIEYQVATNMIYEGMTNEGISIVKGLADRYNPAKHNPWNEIECGDHYARAMASWGVLIALEDFYFNGPEKIIAFNPKIQADRFSGFFTGAEGWGNIMQSRNANEQINQIRMAYGRVTLHQVELGVTHAIKSVRVSIGTKTIPSTFKNINGKLVILFNEQTIHDGQDLQIKITT
jgi:non-lysosomal glucosylceramidase